jgi:PAS domain S-box-containing protein
MAGSVVDVTDRVEATLRLQASEKRFRDYTEAASDWYWETDVDHRFTFLSERLVEIAGVRREDILGKTRTEIAEGATDTPEWRKHLADLEARRPFRQFEYFQRRPDGPPRLFQTSGKPVFDEEGRFAGYRGVTADITAQRASEQRIRQVEGILTEAIRGMSEGFLVLDPKSRFVMCNDRYREFYPAIADLLVPGTSFEAILRRCVLAGEVEATDPEAVIASRLESRGDGFIGEGTACLRPLASCE